MAGVSLTVTARAELLAGTRAPCRASARRRRSFGISCRRRGPHAVRSSRRPPPPPDSATRHEHAQAARVCRRERGSRTLSGRPRHGPPRAGGRGLRGDRLEARLVRVVAVRAQQVALVAVPLADAAAVHARPPVAQLLAVALPAQAVRLLERHRLAAREVQHVAVRRVVAVEAPAVLLVVLQDDVGVHVLQLAARAVDREVAWQLVHGKMPSVNGGGGTSGRSLAAWPAREAPADAGRVGRRPAPRQQRRPRGASARRPRRHAPVLTRQLRATTRWISRSHIAWKTCRRWPTMAETLVMSA